MIQAIYNEADRALIVRADPHYDRKLKTLPGVKKPKNFPDAWQLPVDLEILRTLEGMGARMDDSVTDIYGRLVRVQQWVEQMKASDIPEPLYPPPIKEGYELYRHQVRAYNLGLVLRSFAALMDMGTGKSLTTIAIAGRRFLNGKIKRLLIVAPTSVVSVWPREFAQYAAFPHKVAVLLGSSAQRIDALRQLQAPSRDSQSDQLLVAVINYESTWRLHGELQAFAPDMVVCDESQRIKNHAAQQSKAIHKLGDMAKYRMILTGTPVQNNPLDFFSQYRFLNPNVFGTNFYMFRNRYAVMGGYQNHSVVAYRNIDEMTRKAHSIAYRVTKEECLDLPEQTFQTQHVELPKASQETYRQIKKESIAILQSGGTVTANNVLLRLLRLQQLTGGFLTEDDAKRPKPDNTSKLDALRDILEDYVLSVGKKLVIFARFIPEIRAIEELMNALRIDYAAIWGDVPMAERGGLVERFQTDPDCKVFIAQIQTAGLGITLTAADTAVYYSLDFNLAAYQQSLARIHRIGQRNTCTYIHLVVPDTVDEHILEALSRKEELARRVVDNWENYFGED